MKGGTMTVKTHLCNKETEIALIQKDMAYTKEKVDIIYEKLMGNGKPGLFDEINQVKGSVKAMAVLGSVITFVMSLIIFYINFVKN